MDLIEANIFAINNIWQVEGLVGPKFNFVGSNQV
jgi:hypothetical protein